MTEIEEYLLMLFLESINSLDLYCRLYDANHPLTVRELDILNTVSNNWLAFKEEELGNTIPEEFEFFVSDWAMKEIKDRKYLAISTCLWMNQWDKCKHKIKIMVVEDD